MTPLPSETPVPSASVGPSESVGDQRRVPVPDGLEGERLDAALARMFGLSRARAADLIADGLVLVDGQQAAKSHRVVAGSWP
jgi:23S rRNA pseudouridine1911/1915/1917 synthase